MANPQNHDIRSNRLGDMVTHMSFTATGTNAAQTLTTGKTIVLSATTSGTGVLTVVLKERWNTFANHIGKVQQASYAAGGAVNIELTDQSATATTATLVFQITQSTGAAVALASGDIVRISLFMSYVKA